MSQVRENSNPNCDEHVSSSTSTATTTTTGTSSLTSDVVQDMEISIRIPPADQQCSSEDDLGGHERDRKVQGNRRRRNGRNSELNNTSELRNEDDCSDLKIDSCGSDLKNDRSVREGSLTSNNNHSNDRSSDNASDPNNDDSDPPVENYIFQEGEFQFDDDDEDDMLLVPEETHHNLLTAQEQRQLQKRRAQSGHYRKRKKSANIDSNYVPPYAKKRFRRQTSVLPSKFLLGGNIRDPLNLASLADAKVNAALNAETPKSSPLPVPVYRQGEVPVFIPKNPDDPLGLQSNEANTPYDCIAGIRKKNTRKHRHRKKGGRRRTDSECSIDNKSEDSDAKDVKDTSVSSEEELKGSGDPGEADKISKDSNLTESGQSSGQQPVATSDGVGAEVPKSEEEIVIPGPSKTCKASSSIIIGAQAAKQLNSGTTVNSKAQIFVAPNPKQSLGPPISKQQVPGPGPSNVVDPMKDEKVGNSKDENNSDSSGPINDSKSEDVNLNKNGTTTSDEANNLPDKNNFPKRKSRQRKRARNKQGLFRFRPGFYLSGQSSDYVPLGTPSVHEANLYQFSPGGPEYFEQPFQSPSISNFVSQEPSLCMEPFSPPPKPEIKRRRIVEALPETVSTANPPPAAPVSIIPDVPQETQVTPKAPTNCFKQPPPPSKLHIRHNNFRKRFRHKSDPIVSPVIPQPGSRRRFNQHHFGGGGGHHKRVETNEEGILQDKEVSGVKYRKKDEVFQYGNYNRYYGYRISEEGMDMRLSAFPKEIFASKEVLDVGCNIGHVTMLIARDYGAKRVLGIDIDPKLIEVAKKNVKHYVDRDPSDETIRFPHSCPLMYGVLQPPPGTVGDTRKIPFPYNVSFRQENYVLESDDLLEGVTPEYDVILCLSITKWIHLNNGDDGLKRFFRRAFLHLRPGGKLILEPQPWSSYKRKKKLTEQIFATFKAIRFYPDKFQDFLLKEVGFSTMEKLTTPTHTAKGFQRPLMVFTKADKAECTPKRSPSHPQLGLVEMITTSTVVPACSPALFVSSSPPNSSAPSDQPTSPHLIKDSLADKESGDE
ncbi:unnamed protein product [Allacma fusca]|uniref:RNA methyltransferase n=1 Tax=Allacma fusca TaxID=39272 RepID=A0A8J2KN01_9HEXA|nr:unnamed protein product [Allacma fusca]